MAKALRMAYILRKFLLFPWYRALVASEKVLLYNGLWLRASYFQKICGLLVKP